MPKVTLKRQQIIDRVLRKPEEGAIEVSEEWAKKLKDRGALVESTPAPAPTTPTPAKPTA